MATCNLFEEDEVYVENQGKGVNFGLVLENAEFFSSSDEDDDDKVDERLQKGTVRVAWHPTGKETVVAENKVHLVDRSLMPGDIVRHLIQGQETQCGFVTDVDIRCHVHVLRTNKYIYNINSKDLQPLQKFSGAQEVLFNSWLGRVENVNYELIVIFQDGAKCQVDEDDMFNFEDVSDKRSRHGEFSFCHHYPGQELKGSMDSLSDAKWLHSTPRFCSRVANKKGKTFMVHVTVEKIVTKSVEVQWVFRGYEKVDNLNDSVSPPPRSIEGENVEKLQILDWFSHCNVQIGDRMTYAIKDDDTIADVTPRKAFDPKVTLLKDAPFKIVEEMDIKNQSNSTNVSQNVEKELDETEDPDIDDDDFESESDEKLGASSGRITGGRKKKNRGHKGTLRHKPGKPNHSIKVSCGRKRTLKERVIKPGETVEVEVEFTMSWVTVMWQDGSTEKDIPSCNLFPVHHLDDSEFFPGDFVLPTNDLAETVDYGVVVKADHHERTCIVHWFKAYDIGKATAPTLVEKDSEMSVYDIKDHPDYKYRPGHSIVRVGGFENSDLDKYQTLQTIGQILQLDPSGYLVIRWADGSISQHYPQEIFVVSDEADNFSEDSWESEDNSDDSSETWETESEHEIIGEENGAKADTEGGGYDQDILCEHKQELDSLLGRAETALFRLQNHLNNFGVTVQSPECFHDIIRIYRSCHDLDKILQSSFFNDPELQSLISQAKAELRRDKANKISKHLSQLFDTWSKSLPVCSNENVGTVAIAGKTIKVGMIKGKESEVCLLAGDEKNDLTSENVGDSSLDNLTLAYVADSGLDTAICLAEGGVTCAKTNLAASACSLTEEGSLNLKKEVSEPSLSNSCKVQDSGCRRLSDPFNDTSVNSGAKIKKKNLDALVGENCVSKAAKRAKSDSYDDSGREVKKSRDETRSANHIAQELCSLICQNLQKQILRIHDEVNKRTNRLLSSSRSSKQNNDKTQVTNDSQAKVNSSSENVDLNQDKEVSNSENKETVKDSNTLASTGETQPESKGSIAVGSRSDENHKLDFELTSESCNSLDMETSPEEVKSVQIPCKGFDMYGEVVSCHKYVSQESQPANPRTFRTAVKKELKLFQSSLPDGIFIKGFENRLDLYSVMILGPEGTPYEDAVFLFDLKLPNDYPNSPPLCFYHSYCTDRLNPNLYEDGKVCVSLLGTWSGKGTEVWTSKSNLLQVIVSIQGLILVPEPYYNEAGYEKQRGTQVGLENSRMYNEMAIIKTIQSLIKMCTRLPFLFKQEVYSYVKAHGPRMIARLRKWLAESEKMKKLVADTDFNVASCTILLSNTNLSQGNLSEDSQGQTSTSHLLVSSQDSCYLIGDRSGQDTVSNTNATASNTNATADCKDKGDCSCVQTCNGNCDDTNELCSVMKPSSEGSSQGVVPADSHQSLTADKQTPHFPLLPMSKGFCLTLQKTLSSYEKALHQLEPPLSP
ncbi:hypothetical protein Btru_022138 [Bulinus truncatus]|nr:hypothetical protein Btru_022138 [Bulinus truncatus]